MTAKVRIAKKDLFAEIPNGEGQKIRQLVARKGQEVPLPFLQYVDEADTTTERVKTRSTPVLGSATRTGAERRAGIDGERVEPDHADVRTAAAVVDPAEAEEAPAVAPASDEVLAENAELREQLAEAEARAQAAEAEAEEARAAASDPDAASEKQKEEEAEVKDAADKEGSAKAETGAKNKAQTKSTANKARESGDAKTK